MKTFGSDFQEVVRRTGDQELYRCGKYSSLQHFSAHTTHLQSDLDLGSVVSQEKGKKKGGGGFIPSLSCLSFSTYVNEGVVVF